MILEFESLVDETLSLFAKINNKRNQLVRAHSRVSRRNLMRVDEGRNSWSLLAMTTKPRAVVGRGGKSLVSGPRSGLPLGRGKEKETCEYTTVGGASKEEKKKEVGALSFSAKTRQWHRSSLRTTAT